MVYRFVGNEYILMIIYYNCNLLKWFTLKSYLSSLKIYIFYIKEMLDKILTFKNVGFVGWIWRLFFV